MCVKQFILGCCTPSLSGSRPCAQHEIWVVGINCRKFDFAIASDSWLFHNTWVQSCYPSVLEILGGGISKCVSVTELLLRPIARVPVNKPIPSVPTLPKSDRVYGVTTLWTGNNVLPRHFEVYSIKVPKSVGVYGVKNVRWTAFFVDTSKCIVPLFYDRNAIRALAKLLKMYSHASNETLDRFILRVCFRRLERKFQLLIFWTCIQIPVLWLL